MSITVTSLMPSGNAAVTRNADALSFPFSSRPQAMTVYIRGLNRTVGVLPNQTVPRPWAVGDFTAAPCFFLALNPLASVNIRPRAGIALSSTSGVTPAIADLVEIVATLSANGSVQVSVALNGGAVVVAPASGTTPLPQTWLAPTLLIGAAASSAGMDITHLLILAGVQSLATMQRRAGTFVR